MLFSVLQIHKFMATYSVSFHPKHSFFSFFPFYVCDFVSDSIIVLRLSHVKITILKVLTFIAYSKCPLCLSKTDRTQNKIPGHTCQKDNLAEKNYDCGK